MRAVNRRNVAVLALVVLVTAVVLVRWLNAEPEAVPAVQQASAGGIGAGEPAPAFTLKDNAGREYKVGGPRDKAMIVNFWASWCDPCQQEAPELNAMALKYKNVLDIYGVNVTSQDYKPNAERFIRKYMLAFPVMFDLKGEVFDQYRGQVFPTNVLIDKNGKVTEVVLGALTREELEKKIIALTGS
ncbi:TlpA family protein disulfide reductase [Paenibacillus typhae]|uniref:TlpA family protein disulfide reductase n=1 Tax=Paenibacillus typhae TaxID=1174501 RepID=UPI001C8D7101|nr:TlpA disulfide reductase family protein [Paenibacillus typhae]MBY0009022.1 TlpA family protein disulfide reductase [Paenibacillus typhae]